MKLRVNNRSITLDDNENYINIHYYPGKVFVGGR